ncbi:hypothetical protein AMAG_01569 [Allomyces macrogynus ATCC 38327]|uniref:Cyclic nucleotide-binding domain-containing protein n=1 Tax=Allomyces macrogynus (strain ATCC 38327) TaxID=578462 RepID=A0A0L0RZD0_ALLM3|nr:hypothetical protein AMAG_01569 [Allomyces macrogynus ATCC 38327]|eukprot:KNE55683.1 hypothetical protein AMAG_01569 [Allomyces macrogynus ATCC 38327]
MSILLQVPGTATPASTRSTASPPPPPPFAMASTPSAPVAAPPPSPPSIPVTPLAPPVIQLMSNTTDDLDDPTAQILYAAHLHATMSRPRAAWNALVAVGAFVADWLDHYIVLLPGSWITRFWTWTVLVAALTQAIVVPFRIAFGIVTSQLLHSPLALNDASEESLAVERAIASTVLVADIFLGFRKAFYSRRGLIETGSWNMATRQARQSLFWDLAGNIPWEVFLAPDAPFAAKALLPLTRCIVLFKIFQWVHAGEDRLTGTLWVQATKLVVMLGLISHYGACVWWVAGLPLAPSEQTWSVAGGTHSAIDFTNLLTDDVPSTTRYSTSMYWALLVFTAPGHADLVAPTLREKMVGLGLFFVGHLAIGYTVASVTSMLANSGLQRVQFVAKVASITQFLRTSKFDKATQGRVLAFYEFLWQRNGGINTQDLFADLPTAFQTELAVWMNGPLLSSVPIFHDTEEGFMRMLSLALRPVMFLPNEFVVRKGDLGSEMYMVHSGILEVVSDDGTQIFDRICDGGFFGEISLFFARPRTANVRTVTFVDLYVLTKAGLDDVLQFYPSIKLKIMATAQQRLQDLEKRLRTRADSLKSQNLGVLTAVVPPVMPVPLASAHMTSAPASPTIPIICEQDDERPPPSLYPPPAITMNSPVPLPGTPVGASTYPNASSTTTSSGSTTSSVFPSTPKPTLPHPNPQAQSSMHLAPNSPFTTAGRGGSGSNISLAARSQQALLSLARALGSHDTMHSASGTMTGARRGSTALERAARNQAVLQQRPRQASIASREIMPGTSLVASRRASILSVQGRPETVARSQNSFVSTNDFATPEGVGSALGVSFAPATMAAAAAVGAAAGMGSVTTVESTTAEPDGSGSGGDAQTSRFFSDGSHLDLKNGPGPGGGPVGNQVAAFSDLEPVIDAPHEDESANTPFYASVMSLDARSSGASTRQARTSISRDMQSPVLDRALSNTVLTGRPLRAKHVHGTIAEEGPRDVVSARLKSLSASLNAMGGSLSALGEVVLPDSLCGVHYTQIATATVPAVSDAPTDAAPTTSMTISTHPDNADPVSTTPESSRRVSHDSSLRGLPTSASVMSTHSHWQLGGGSLGVPRTLERNRTPSAVFRNIMSGGLSTAMSLHGSSSGENGSVGHGSLSRQRTAAQVAHSGAITADVELLLAGLAEPPPPPAPTVSQVRAQRGRGVGGGIRGAFMPASGPLPRLMNPDSSGAALPGLDALVSGPLPRGTPMNSDERVGAVHTNSQEAAAAARTLPGSVLRSRAVAGAAGTLPVTSAPRKGSSLLHRAIVPSDAGSTRSRSELELGAESESHRGSSETSTAPLKTAKLSATLPNRGGGQTGG